MPETEQVTDKRTKFEQDLEAFFPEIAKLHELAKDDKFLWEAIYAVLEVKQAKSTGNVRIHVNKGFIDGISKQIEVLYGRSNEPNKDL